MRIICVIVLFLAACSSTTNSKYSKSGYGAETAPRIYKVKSGDTLFSIGWRYGLDTKAIMQRNGISNPNKIFVGQKLYLNTSRTASSSIIASKHTAISTSQTSKPHSNNWVWPMRGRLLKSFNAGNVGANGIRISGKPNQTVNAAEGGTVAYKGNGLKGYGNVIIIKHNNGLLSAYGFLSKTYVKEGQKIMKRQKIGTVGFGPNNQLMLHFEVRKDGSPTNPTRYIGSQYHF